MNKGEGKGEVSKPGKQNNKSGSSKPPPPKRNFSDVSPNCSLEEITVLTQQIDGLSDDMKTVRENLNMIMKREEMEIFIKETVTKIISDLNENIDMMVEIKVTEKTKEMKEKLTEVEDENKHLKNDIISMKSQLTNLKTKMVESEERSKMALSKANYNEQYSRKTNIKVMNITEQPNETEEKLKASFCDKLKDKDLSFDPNKILAIHRIPGKTGQPKPVLVKLTNNNEKIKIMQKRKEFKTSGNRLVDDVTKLNVDLIKRLLEHRKIEQAWYFNGNVYGKTESGRRCKFDLFDNIDEVLRS